MPKLQRNFIEITLQHGCCPVSLLHIFRIPFPKRHLWRTDSYINTSKILITISLIHRDYVIVVFYCVLL